MAWTGNHWSTVGLYIGAVVLVAAAISNRLATPQLALASAAAFLMSETIDWGVYSLTGRPFADRVLLSVAFSAPVDTALFLLLANIWSWQLFGLGLGAKLVAGLAQPSPSHLAGQRCAAAV
ncbi:MAG: hypothetical protein EBU30_00435 [Synechococcaceae bacterium WB6_3B_236]|nr:hypothetical protein [Synechococcaceae bacterium WB6_3B_236]